MVASPPEAPLTAGAALWLVLPLLLLRAGPRWRPAPWSTPRDLALIGGTGLAAALLHSLWLADFVLGVGQLSASPDHLEYCWNTGALATELHGSGGDPARAALAPFGRNRSRAAALLPALFAGRVGIETGLNLAALASQALLCGGLVLFGRAAHSRLAGVAAALLLGAVAPLVILGRTPTFYPEVLAGLVICAATGLAALRWRGPAALLAAGTGAGLALLIDQRGLIWALPTVGLGALAALWGPGRRPWAPGRRHRTLAGLPLRLAALVLPLVLSFRLGAWAYPPDARSLEAHASPLRELRDRGFLPADTPVSPRQPTRFVWGHTPVTGIPASLARVAALQAQVPPAAHQTAEALDGRRWWVAPWELPALGALALVAWGLRRRPLLLFGVLGLVLPFWLSLESAAGFKRAKPRFLANAQLYLPMLLGIAAAVLALGPHPGRRGGAPGPGEARGTGRGAGLRLGAATLVITLLVLGIVPSWLSPVARWRVALRRNDTALRAARSGARDHSDSALDRCLAARAAWAPPAAGP